MISQPEGRGGKFVTPFFLLFRGQLFPAAFFPLASPS